MSSNFYNSSEQVKTTQYDLIGINVLKAQDLCVALDEYVSNINKKVIELEKIRNDLFGDKLTATISNYSNLIIEKIYTYTDILLGFKSQIEYVISEWKKVSENAKNEITSSNNEIPSNSQNTSNANSSNTYNLTDKQEMLVTKFSYINLDEEKLNKDIASGAKVTVKDLDKYLINSDKAYLGFIAKYGIGVNQTNQELLQELINSGLGDYTVADVCSGSKSGLNAIVLSDSNGNKYFSYRGTEFDISSKDSIKSTAKDVITDVKEYFTGKNNQLDEARDFYNKNKSTTGNNYMYGHSLAGNIVNNLFAENSEKIKKVFVVNALPLGDDETMKKINNSDNYKSVVIEGDWVSRLKGNISNENTVVANNNNTINNVNIFANHAIESAKYDDNGNFITTDKNDSSSKVIKIEEKIIDTIDDIGKSIKNVSKKES